MKKLIILVVAFLVFSSSIANATLILKGTDTLGNRLIYDTDLDITCERCVLLQAINSEF